MPWGSPYYSAICHPHFPSSQNVRDGKSAPSVKQKQIFLDLYFFWVVSLFCFLIYYNTHNGVIVGGAGGGGFGEWFPDKEYQILLSMSKKILTDETKK